MQTVIKMSRGLSFEELFIGPSVTLYENPSSKRSGILKSKKTVIVFTCLFVFSCCPQTEMETKICSGQKEKECDVFPLLTELNGNITEIPSGTPLEYQDGVFSKLDKHFKDAQIFGLGEGTHGTKEFFELKHRLFQYLVEKHNVRVLGYEFDFRFMSALKIERFVVQGKGELDSLVGDMYWTHRNKEFKNLIEWMKKYNSDKNDKDVIHFLGIDSQLDIWHPSELVSYISDLDIGLYESAREILHQINTLGKTDYKRLTKDRYQEIETLFSQLKIKTQQYFKDDPTVLKEKERKIVIHLIESYLLSHEFLFGAYNGRVVRDSHMAEHCIWLKDFVGENKNVAIWAHNSHIANDPVVSRDGGSAMGKYIKDKMGEKYLAIATVFTNGRFMAVTEDYLGKDTQPIVWNIKGEPPDDSINYLLSKAKYKNFFFGTNELSDTKNLYAYLNKAKPLFGVGDFYSTTNPEVHYLEEDRLVSLTTAFDVVFYFTDTSPINIIEKTQSEAH